MIIAVAIEDKGKEGIGRIRLWHVPDAYAQSLHTFIEHTVQKGSQIRTDDWTGYEGIKKLGYNRSIASSEDTKRAHHII